jgi:hypothetical protein
MFIKTFSFDTSYITADHIDQTISDWQENSEVKVKILNAEIVYLRADKMFVLLTWEPTT